MTLRTYLYISDAKVDMYLQQFDQVAREKLAAKVNLNVGVLSAGHEAERSVIGNRVSRLQAVETVVRAENEIGATDSDASWIEGTGPFAHATFAANRDVTFFYFANEDLLLGLGGSSHHVVGNIRPANSTVSYSYLHSLLGTLALVDGAASFVMNKDDEDLSEFITAGVTSIGSSAWIPPLRGLAQSYSGAAKQQLHFLARRLSSEIDHDGRRVTLATPLFIAAGPS